MPALPWAVVYLIAVLVFLIALGIELIYTHTLGALLNGIARLFFMIRLRIFGHTIISAAAVGRGVQRLDHTIRAAIGDAVTGSEHAVLKLWSGGGVIASYIGRSFVGLANETVRTMGLLRHVTIPQMIAAALGPVELLLVKTHRFAFHYLRAAIAGVEHDVYGVGKRQRASEGDIGRLGKVIGGAVGAIGGALIHPGTVTSPGQLTQPGSVARPSTLPGSISIDWPLSWPSVNIRKRLGRLEKLLGISALVGAGLYALSKVAPWARCSNVDKVGRNVCRMDHQLLDSLLADTLVIVGTLSLVEFAEDMLLVTGELARGTQEFWRATQ